MKHIVCIAASTVVILATVACGGKSDKKATESAGAEPQTESVGGLAPERIEVTLTTPAEDVAKFMEEVKLIDAMIEECEATGDDVTVPTIQEMTAELDRRIVAYAKAYLDRSETEFTEFCTLLDVEPDHIREGFKVYGY